MSAHDIAPVGVHAGSWWDETDEEREEYLLEVFFELPLIHRERHHHDRNGWYAELAGSEACLALGHRYDPDGATDDDTWLPEDQHGYGWQGEQLCTGTRYGVACTDCEGECDQTDPVDLWSLPGVAAAAEPASV